MGTDRQDHDAVRRELLDQRLRHALGGGGDDDAIERRQLRRAQKAVAGERLSPAEGLRLLESHDLAALGRAADAVTRRLHPESYRTYNIDRNINYTNVCAAVCDFCAFFRKSGEADAYLLSREEPQTDGAGNALLDERDAAVRDDDPLHATVIVAG